VKQALCLLDAELPIERPPWAPFAVVLAHLDLLKTKKVIVFATNNCNTPLCIDNSNRYYGASAGVSICQQI
jgi:hypothetical protein